MKRILTGIVVAGALVVGTASATSLGSFTDVTFAASDVELQPCEAGDINLVPSAVDTTNGPVVTTDTFGVAAITLSGLTDACLGKLVDVSFISNVVTPGADAVYGPQPGAETACGWDSNFGQPPFGNLLAKQPLGGDGACTHLGFSTAGDFKVMCTSDGPWLLGPCVDVELVPAGDDVTTRTVLSTQRGLVTGDDPAQTLKFPSPLPLDIELITDVELVLYDAGNKLVNEPVNH